MKFHMIYSRRKSLISRKRTASSAFFFYTKNKKIEKARKGELHYGEHM